MALETLELLTALDELADETLLAAELELVPLQLPPTRHAEVQAVPVPGAYAQAACDEHQPGSVQV
jgi:hypothetical protein